MQTVEFHEDKLLVYHLSTTPHPTIFYNEIKPAKGYEARKSYQHVVHSRPHHIAP